MFNNLGWGEIAALAIIGLIVFGPERLPKVAADAGRLLRQLRQMARGLNEDLRAELGPEVADLDLASLRPRRFVEKHLFEDDDSEDGAATRRSPRRVLPPGARPPFDHEAT